MKEATAIDSIWFTEDNDQLFSNIVDAPGPAVLSLLWEAIPPTEWLARLCDLVDRIKNKNPNRIIILIVNSWYKPYFKQLTMNINDILYIDFFLLLVYHRLIVGRESAVTANWTPGNKKFLFLTGKCDKINRVVLLYKFFTRGMLSRAVWSLFFHHESFEKAKKYLPELNHSEYTKFFMDHCCNPDDADVILNSSGSIHYNGIPYRESLYADCDFQVISETGFTDRAWITEKTWLSIINRRPFIMAGDIGTLKKLKQMGFRTFEQYLKIVNYDELTDPEQRLTAIVDNTQHWLEHIQEYQNLISQDVEHNFNRLVELAVVNIENIQKVIDRYRLDSTATVLAPLYDYMSNSKWKHFYAGVRDISWPDCHTENDFVNLPDWIQKECIEAFGYKPKELK